MDDLRKDRPHLGFALYALDPGGAVTFEVYDGDQVFTFVGLTASSAIEKAFPAAPAVVESEPPPTPSVFD